MNDVEEKVRNIVASQLGLEFEEVFLASSFSNDLGADSLDAVVR
jgi:acyl carrier protein